MAKDQKVTPGFLPISDAMARDLDNGRADNRALDDFLPDSVLQELHDSQQANSSPVHGEDLIPISKAEAARRTTFDGESLPTTLPKTRRVIPAPYRRDRVVGGKHGKKWHELTAEQIRRGDIVTDIGLVTWVGSRMRYETVEGVENVAVGADIEVWGGDNNRRQYDAKETVRVFR